MDSAQKLINTATGQTVNVNLAGTSFQPSYFQAAAIVLLLFLLVLTVAKIRKLYVGWSLGKSSIAMIMWGFILTVIIEGFFLLSGRTILTEFLGWKNAPKPIQTALDSGRGKLVDVLGESTQEVPTSSAEEPPTYQSVISDYQTLSSQDASQVRSLICK